ncbi:hypothetical protein [Tuberibacillus sp. Marseille-P3662]|nr:hypothetical protein [Tuberibacillus sp. Marseille-P3662]
MNCRHCDGHGDMTCPYCQGKTAYLQEECPTCDGYATIECSYCSGAGIID